MAGQPRPAQPPRPRQHSNYLITPELPGVRSQRLVAVHHCYELSASPINFTTTSHQDRVTLFNAWALPKEGSSLVLVSL